MQESNQTGSRLVLSKHKHAKADLSSNWQQHTRSITAPLRVSHITQWYRQAIIGRCNWGPAALEDYIPRPEAQGSRLNSAHNSNFLLTSILGGSSWCPWDTHTGDSAEVPRSSYCLAQSRLLCTLASAHVLSLSLFSLFFLSLPKKQNEKKSLKLKMCPSGEPLESQHFLLEEKKRCHKVSHPPACALLLPPPSYPQKTNTRIRKMV